MKGQELLRYFLDFCALIAMKVNEILNVEQMTSFSAGPHMHNSKTEFKADYSFKIDNFIKHVSTLKDIAVN